MTAKSSLEPGFSSDDDASSTATDERIKKKYFFKRDTITDHDIPSVKRPYL